MSRVRSNKARSHSSPRVAQSRRTRKTGSAPRRSARRHSRSRSWRAQTALARRRRPPLPLPLVALAAPAAVPPRARDPRAPPSRGSLWCHCPRRRPALAGGQYCLPMPAIPMVVGAVPPLWPGPRLQARLPAPSLSASRGSFQRQRLPIPRATTRCTAASTLAPLRQRRKVPWPTTRLCVWQSRG